MPQINACRPGSELPHCRRIALRIGGNRQSARDAAIALPTVKPHQAGKQQQRIAKKRQHRQRQNQKRHRRLEVDQPQHDLLRPTAKMRRQKPHHGAEHRRDHGGAKRDAERHLDRYQQPAQHITPELIRAQRMHPAAAEQHRRRQPRPQIHRRDAKRSQRIGKDRHQQNQQQPTRRQPNAGRHTQAADHARTVRKRGSNTP